jgi:hypothetical protein
MMKMEEQRSLDSRQSAAPVVGEACVDNRACNNAGRTQEASTMNAQKKDSKATEKKTTEKTTSGKKSYKPIKPYELATTKAKVTLGNGQVLEYELPTFKLTAQAATRMGRPGIAGTCYATKKELLAAYKAEAKQNRSNGNPFKATEKKIARLSKLIVEAAENVKKETNARLVNKDLKITAEETARSVALKNALAMCAEALAEVINK